jgi:glutamate synthase (NADPH/NADH) large chain
LNAVSYRWPLYQPGLEHDACGIALVARLDRIESHELVTLALQALERLEHRGAKGADPDTGDGAGILLANPDSFWRQECSLPPMGAYGTGLVFVEGARERAFEALGQLLEQHGLTLLCTREVPRDSTILGRGSRAAEPDILQVFLASRGGLEGIELERALWRFRRHAEHAVPELYFPSLSTRTFVYKGMLSAPQLARYYPDLEDPALASPLALVHSRFSTNTFPSWRLGQPFRMIAHNGEINTIDGNRNWMRARESQMASELLGSQLPEAFPMVEADESDSASLDAVFELLVMGGRSLPHAMMMMIPEAWEGNDAMDPALRDFYRFHAGMMEPWDGPAAVVFTDGTVAGGVLDRNGLRPARYWVRDDGLVVLASEVGVVDMEQARVVAKGRLEPGRIFLVDLEAGKLLTDEEVKQGLARMAPWGEWLSRTLVSLDDLPPRYMLVPQHGSVVARQQLFGYTQEELDVIIAPMATTGQEPIGSMGSDTPLAVRSQMARPLFDLFTQRFAQVTNPPLDAIREELVTSASGVIGPEENLLALGERSVRQILVPHPIIDNDELAKLVYINEDGGYDDLEARVVDALFPVGEGGEGLARALERIRTEAEQAIRDGVAILILSDRHADWERAPIPSLLAVSAVHHHLVRTKLRTRAGLVVECGDAREVHHFAALIGFGAAAVNPYLVFDTIVDLIREGVLEGQNPRRAVRNYVKAATKGVVKVMSKMGISTVASYTGAQIFEAYGLAPEVVEEYFPGLRCPLGGLGLEEIAARVAHHHRLAFEERVEARAHRSLEVGGHYRWRREGELHLFNPETVFLLQHATRARRFDVFRRYTALVDDLARRGGSIRGLLELDSPRPPVPLEEVEPASSIMRRFATGAMSYGSISKEAHETLAIAMNRIGGRSNSGEGGEDAERSLPGPDGLDRRSRIRQVASARFGVTNDYLSKADDLQIKIAQGAKPGEGGQLPGEKVYPWIARTRKSTPGVGLISPPPHHDIYSIEDLAQLIYDLKSANRRARVHVKLVSEVGVGTVAAGVAKAHADVILVSGGDGGTGAAPLTSQKHAGGPWELGLAETVQTLEANGLRDRVVLQVDGQMKTGRDVIVAALLGAEEYGFASAPLVVSGCIMMRVCHLDTCPVGIATQNPELRARFSGRPEFVETFFEYLAEEVRGYLAALGFRSLEEAIGHTEVLRPVDSEEARRLGLWRLLAAPASEEGPRGARRSQPDVVAGSLNEELVRAAASAIERGARLRLSFAIRNTDRSVGAMLGDEVARRFGEEGMPEDRLEVLFAGSAGQSFGAFLPRGVSFVLEGDANDYVAKGLSGGRIVVRPALPLGCPPEEAVIIGNVALYGATSGALFVRGRAGERFAVRNSGAWAVVEGVGDHGCEYMTGGVVAVLGPVGRNFAAGMSGGLAFLWDPHHRAGRLVNQEMVELDPLEPEHMALLEELVTEHAQRTGSERAREVLARRAGWAHSFVCVFPRDLKRVVLEERAAAQQGAPLSLIATNRGY